MYTFARFITGRGCVVFIDNTSALGVLRNGRCATDDLNELAFLTHTLASAFDARLSFHWVPSALNWADPPSRGQAARGEFVQDASDWGAIRASLEAS